MFERERTMRSWVKGRVLRADCSVSFFLLQSCAIPHAVKLAYLALSHGGRQGGHEHLLDGGDGLHSAVVGEGWVCGGDTRRVFSFLTFLNSERDTEALIDCRHITRPILHTST